MKTPRTEAVVRMAIGPMREYAIIDHAQNLERENITLREALEKIKRHGPIMGSTGDYRQGQLDILENVSTIASIALANAKDQEPEGLPASACSALGVREEDVK